MLRPAIIAVALFVPTSVDGQTFSIGKLEPSLNRKEFMAEGRSGSVALSAGVAINSEDAAKKNDDFRLLEDRKCYRVINEKPISSTRRLYFAINHNAKEVPYRNAFLAAQVVRFIRSNAMSDVAVSRNFSDSWVKLDGHGKPGRVGESKFLRKQPQEFAAAHTLQGGKFDKNKIGQFFAPAKVEWHARLPKMTGESSSDGHYSSLDDGLEEVWAKLQTDYQVKDKQSYQVLVRSYLISFKFGTNSAAPIVFYTDPLGSEFLMVRIASPADSNFAVDRTFSIALRENCMFMQSSGRR